MVRKWPNGYGFEYLKYSRLFRPNTKPLLCDSTEYTKFPGGFAAPSSDEGIGVW